MITNGNKMLILKDLEKTYKISREVKVNALKSISLQLDSKGLVFVVGKSGSGKSTLLNLLGGLTSPTSGDIFIENKSISNLPMITLYETH